MASASTNALARIGSPKAALATVQDLVARMRDIQDQAIVCSPFANLDGLPEFFKVSERVVTINPDPQQREVYFSKQFCSNGEVALAKPGLLKLWLASGGKVIASHRTDDRSNRHICSWTVVGEVRQIDGNVVRFHGSRTLDYTDSSDQIKGLSTGDVANKRRAIESLAETFAMERMIRGVINLGQKYSAKDLAEKPFVCYALVPDSSRCDDPMIRRLFAAEALGIVDKVFGAAPNAPALPPAAEIIETADGTVNTVTGELVEDAADFDAPPVDPPAKAAPVFVCGCPCGDQTQIPADVAEKTTAMVGAPRCKACYPGAGFVLHRHLDVKSLGLDKAKWPDGMTPAKADIIRIDAQKKAAGVAR